MPESVHCVQMAIKFTHFTLVCCCDFVYATHHYIVEHLSFISKRNAMFLFVRCFQSQHYDHSNRSNRWFRCRHLVTFCWLFCLNLIYLNFDRVAITFDWLFAKCLSLFCCVLASLFFCLCLFSILFGSCDYGAM